MKKVLLVCYYFPPMGMGGTQRSAKFVKYLPAFDWEPIVLTVKDVKYYALDNTLLDDVKGSEIIRTESLDPLRLLRRFGRSADAEPDNSSTSHQQSKILNFFNRFFISWCCLPDSKILWLPFLLIAALKKIQQHKIDIVYSSSPPHSAHLAGLILKLLKKIKLVVDFRDDWSGGESQPSPTRLHDFFNRLLEKMVLKSADAVISMCDPLTETLFRKSGRWQERDKFITLTNGYDSEDFVRLIHEPLAEKFSITHCGSISKVSDPEPFLRALAMLLAERPELTEKIQVKFIGTDLFGRLSWLINKYQLQDSISPVTYLSHAEALKKIMQSHVLLLSINKTSQEEIITSKVFEYLASGKSILLISKAGAVAKMINTLNRGTVVNPENIAGIKEAILSYYQNYENKRLPFVDPLSDNQFDRKLITGQLAEVFVNLKS